MTNKKNNRNRCKVETHHTSTPKVQINEEELLNQCLQLHELLKDRTNRLRKLETGDFCYILSTKWLRDWKDYVGYQFSTEEEGQSKYKDKSYGRKKPGKINVDITASAYEMRDFYSLPKEMKEYDFLGQIIGEKKQKDDDYIAVTQDIWFAFLQFYEGEEIRRPVRKLKGSTFYDSEPLRCDTIIVNLQNQQLEEQIKKTSKKSYNMVFPSNKMLLPTIWDFKTLFNFCKEYCKYTYGHENIRIWKGYGYTATNPIVEGIVESIKQKKYLIKGRLLTQQRYGDMDIDQFIKNTHTLIIEIGQALTQQKEEDKIWGYCEQCIKKTNLTISCVCNQVVYCSERCRIDDQVFHYKTCQEAFASQDDEQYEKKQTKQLPKAGLENLGNTCYMNSVLQAILSLTHLREFFSSNQFLKHMCEKEVKDNNCMFLRKWSKTVKQLTEQESSYTPWPIKGQIDFNLSPFKGYKQHDANDFFINFLNTMNDHLSKEGDKAYHKILEPFVGQFHSKVICPHCNVKSENNQIFLQISLPIKTKSKIATYNYSVIESIQKVIKGKANVCQSWPEMKKHVKVPTQTTIFISKEPEGLVLLDESEKLPEKAVKGLKGELVYLENFNVVQNEFMFVVSQVTTKQIFGSKMKAPYGTPYLISINDITTTLGTLWLKIIKTYFFKNKEVLEEATNMEQEYFKQIEETVRLQNQQKLKSQSTAQSTQTKSGEKQEQQKESEECKKIVEHFNNRLKLFTQKIGIDIYINQFKKSRNICAFCTKRCSGCELPKVFDKGFEDFFSNRYDEVRFEVYLRQKLQIEYVQQDLHSAGDPTLHDCLSLFNQPEQLDQQNAWYCENCDSMALAFKELQVKLYPPIIVIHLNRFKTVDGKKMKNSDPIFYNELQLFGKNQYKLIAAIIHQGSMDAGHYWSICLRGDQYYIFNDSKVTAVQNVYNRNAYILIYSSLGFSC